MKEIDMLTESKVIQEIVDKSKDKKPPIGAIPNWLALPNRIVELSVAIIRNAESDRIDTDAVRELAHEIICHCNTIDELRSNKTKEIRFSGAENPKNHKRQNKVLDKQKEYSEQDKMALINLLNFCVNCARRKEPYIQRTGERYYGQIHFHGCGAPDTDGHGNAIVYR